MTKIFSIKIRTVFCAVCLFCAGGLWAQDPNNNSDDYAAQLLGMGAKQEQPNMPNDPISFFSNPLGLMDSMNVFRANIGLTRIGDQYYIGMRVQPELAFGKIGIGIDLPLLFNVEDGSMRSEEFRRGVGVLRMVRYFRYGRRKRDPVYFRVGDITGSYLGFGILVNNFTNAASFERRKVGINYDILIDKRFGIEGIYSDFNTESLNLFAVRPYVRPFAKMPIPIVRSLEVGVGFVRDRDNTTQATVDSLGQNTRDRNYFVKSGMRAWSADVGVAFVNLPFFKLLGAIQYASLGRNKSDTLARYFDEVAADPNIRNGALAANYKGGDGLSIGLNAKVTMFGEFLNVDARLERLWYSDHFIPQFFDAVYELDKDAKIARLGTAQRMQGIYGVVSAMMLSKIRVSGGLLLPDEVSESNPALVQANAELINLGDKFSLRGSYIRGGITSLRDALELDDRSLARARFSYNVYKFLAVGLDYYWTFSRQESGEFKINHFVSPYFGLNIPLGFGQQQQPTDGSASVRPWKQ